MQKLFYILILFLLAGNAIAQKNISGKVFDSKAQPLAFANIQLTGTYDGGSADENGLFTFQTTETGAKQLLVSLVGYEPKSINIDLNQQVGFLEISLKESVNSLNAVVVSAGMFEASDEKKMVMLKPLDIVTTAGAGADITAVMQLLPGAGRVGEQEGLFVRGGSANETKTVIDGMIVQNPFFSSTPDVPQRGRFSPFMFKGTAFSTGGYSAQYGQALSSVLLLNTVDKQGSSSNLNLGLNLAGLNATYTHKGWISGNLFYSNLGPFLAMSPTNLGFSKVPQGLGGSLNVNQEWANNATLKIMGFFTQNTSGLRLPIYDGKNGTYEFLNTNNNTFTNAVYKKTWNEGLWQMQSGFSYSQNDDQLSIANNDAQRKDQRSQARFVLSRILGNNNTINFGTEVHQVYVENRYTDFLACNTDWYKAAFVESEFYVSAQLAARVGVRAEHSSLIQKANVAPRISAAYKLGKYAQFSAAAGIFYQNPEKEYLYLQKDLDFEVAKHFIFNYQWIKNGRTFRAEAFEKAYSQLVKEKVEEFDPNPYRFPIGSLANSGSGYARGFDVFLRDQTSIKSGDIWLTYSFLDTKRAFKNYPEMAVPSFATKHNFSLVYKQFVSAISSNLGATFTHTSGRPIYDYAEDFRAVEYTKAFQNLSLMASHVRQTGNHFLVFYATIDNVLGRKNVFGYRYSADGKERHEVKPLLYRTFFLGVSWTIGQMSGRSKETDLNF